MAGTISLSMSQQFDEFGKPLSGGLLYFIEAGTTSTPQNAYQDSALTIAHPNPIILDSAGRVPQFYLADGSIKIRLTDSAGVQQLVADSVLVVGPSSGSGGGGSVDETTVLATGDLKIKYGTGSLTGFVRANGRTIGSVTSGATERANLDTQQLFEYLWGADANLAVSGGRGASASADWTANKTIALPDWAGCAIAGLDDMGAGAKGRLTSSYFGTDATVLGATGGAESHTLTTTQIPSHSHANSLNNPGHSHGYTRPNYVLTQAGGSGSIWTLSIDPSPPVSNTNTNTGGTNITITNANTGGGGAHKNVQPTKLATIYIKL